MRPNELATIVLGIVLWLVLCWWWFGPVAFWVSVGVLVWVCALALALVFVSARRAGGQR